MPTQKDRTEITKCPKCGSRKFVISIFGSICGDCFYEEKGESKSQKEKCSFNHRELPNCYICEKLKCKHPKKQETIDTLIRDLTRVGSIPKSEAKRRIENFIFKARQEAYQEGFISGAHTTSEQANEIHAVELEEETRKAYERGKLENIMMIDRKISKKLKGSKEYSQALKEAYEQGRKYEFYRCREAKIKTAEQSYLAGRGGAIRQVLDFVENENEKSGRKEIIAKLKSINKG